ncbi:MAG: hypothetical protein GSR85_08770 [Desulfurococcales archaeon]|nr:hypothetical protein [Desulfurococcales archaeon]
MAKRRKAKRREKHCRHPCECGWRVSWTREFRHRAQEMGLWESIRQELRDLEKRLRDPGERDRALKLLLSQPVVSYYPYRGKRYMVRRIYFGRQTARAGFVIRQDICRVWLIALVPRSNAIYKRKRWV